VELDGWRAAGRTYTHRGHAVFFRDEGLATSEAVLCLHGFPTASWDWHPLWPALTARGRVIAPDMIGYGFSAKPRPYPYSIADQADLLQGLLRSLGLTRVHVLAHDVGDTVVQELLARGHDFASVCLLNGGLFPETHRPTLRQRLIAGPLGPWLGPLVDEKAFTRSFAAVFSVKPTPQVLHDSWRLAAFNEGPRVVHDLLGYIRERRENRARWVGALHTRAPLLVINGADDPISGAHMVERLRQEVPGVSVVSLPGVGHYPQLEAPQAVLDAYLAFRDARGAAAPPGLISISP
jgi:pimeloyl-ACP methyl ester carboxylesterase